MNKNNQPGLLVLMAVIAILILMYLLIPKTPVASSNSKSGIIPLNDTVFTPHPATMEDLRATGELQVKP